MATYRVNLVVIFLYTDYIFQVLARQRLLFSPSLFQIVLQDFKMQKQLDCHHGILRARVYFAWVDAWLAGFDDTKPGSLKAELTMDELAGLFQEENLLELLNSNKLRQAVQSFQQYHRDGHITLGGHQPPSCDETNILSQKYNPQSDCSCNGIYPVSSNTDDQADMCLTECNAIRNTLDAMQNVMDRPDEWNGASLFSTERLEHAVYELALANDDIQPVPDTCQGLRMAAVIPAIRAPDRRPHTHNDTTMAVNNQIYPTAEQIKLCADAKYFFAIAAGASRCDEGILHAVADSGNDILIGDYCEAADSATLSLLQRVGGAAVAFLKLCTLAGVVPDWLFENLATSIIQFRVLGFYRDHSRGRLPTRIYGSRMTGIVVHRHIDVAIFHGVMPAALATGQQLSEKEYLRIAEVCTLINDLIYFRSDTMRKQRENLVLRGIRGCLCNYLDGLLGRLLDTTTEVLQARTLGSQVIMSFCN